MDDRRIAREIGPRCLGLSVLSGNNQGGARQAAVSHRSGQLRPIRALAAFDLSELGQQRSPQDELLSA